MMNRYWIILGIALVLLGSVLLYQWRSDGQGEGKPSSSSVKHSAPEDKSVVAKDLVDSVDVSYDRRYRGAVVAGDKSFDVSYRRLVTPIVIGGDFSWPLEYGTSPTCTALAHLSLIMLGNDVEEEAYYSCYEDKVKAKRVTQEGMQATGIDSFGDFIQQYGRNVFLNSRVLGETTADGVTLVVVQFAPVSGRSDSQNVRAGIPVVRVGDRYLIRPGAKKNSRVLRELSADGYSLLDQPGG